ncbi:MAG: hypothetical protein A2571_01295 [Candidatus Vogelbacteria bacterium RIFOXYD1_FULL_44_32]|uniref:Uncharacterized protein n=1 Tax=Candidatus Vogelbacteria bacterium RIFOXYD1_FULL_44_32 TaxID=1802438 RepID=A0A1G2QD31_9BACT|nr:MAG: hypothetical protein A2571_01295 [Candidatus Vogelbacteria bacterium RIFOXYD1_FULL_44_32]
MDKNTLTSEEQEQLNDYFTQVQAGEMAQIKDLIENCNSAYQFAKTHSTYIKDWEKTKQQSETKIKNGILPPGVSNNLYRAIIDTTDEVIQQKLERVRDAFQVKFGESIYNYLGPDGKTKKFFGIFG